MAITSSVLKQICRWCEGAKKLITIQVNYSAFVFYLHILEQIVFPSSDCENPDNHFGQCVSIYNCPSLLELIQKANLNDQEKQFIRESRCTTGDGKQPYVCCTEDRSVVVPPITSVTRSPEDDTQPIWSSVRSRSDAGHGHLLPEPPNCGPQSLSNRIYSGNQTTLDQYPWMALLEYVRSKLRAPTILQDSLEPRYWTIE